jgi:molecular chaperone GrpE
MTDETTIEQHDEPTEMSELDALRKEVDEWKDLAHRKAAELENVRRRSILREQELTMFASEHLLTKMIPVLDDLAAAVEASAGSTDVASIKQGIDMIYAKASKIFEDAGVRVIESGVGQPFNVERHEALMHMPSDAHPEGHVIQEVQRGYLLHDKVIRHAKVITSAGSDA